MRVTVVLATKETWPTLTAAVKVTLNTWRLEVKSSQLQGTEPLTSRPQPSKQVLIAFACQLSHLVCYEEQACQLWKFSISQEVKKGPFAALIMWFYLLTTKESLMGKV